jgi:hypothetical protein
MKSSALRGSVLVCAAQAIPNLSRQSVIDAEIAKKGHFWTETVEPGRHGGRMPPRFGTIPSPVDQAKCITIRPAFMRLTSSLIPAPFLF